MAIDFGRMARGVATGYLGQKLANTAANDELKAGIIERAGINFYENTLPDFQKKEKNRSETYSKISNRYSPEIAEYMDQNGFITGGANDYANIVKELGANDNFNETKLKAYLEATDAGTYESRKSTRVSDIQDREKFVMSGLENNQIGSMTAKLFLGKDETTTDATMDTAPKTTTEQVTVPGEMVPDTPIKKMDTVETREVPVESKTVDLPSYADIFGDDRPSTNFFELEREDKIALKGDFDKEYKTKYLNPLTGVREDTKKFEEEYRDLPEAEKAKQTLSGYVYNRHFRENYLPSVGYTYGAVSEGPKENPFVLMARDAINRLKANDPNDPSIELIKADLKERLGTNDLSPYGL